MEVGSLPDSRGSMKKQLLLMALGVAALGCGNDPTSVANANPDPASCLKGSISTGDVKSGALTSASCLRYDFAYSEDSTPYDAYSFKAEKGKGYMFLLERADGVTNWDALLELATVNPATGNEQLLALSDDEGGNGWSRMYFIAPVSGTFYIRASGYDLNDTASYKLTAKSCDSPIPEITGTLSASAQTLSSTDCVLEQPNFVNDSAHVKLFSVFIGPNETKTISVHSTDFSAGFQVYGPAWGVDCSYAYEGCGGGVGEQTKGDPQSITITAQGDQNCNNFLMNAPDQAGPRASRVSASPSVCEQFNWPGQYTIAVGSNFDGLGAFTLSVDAGQPPRVVGPDQPLRNPTLNFLRKKPLRANEYLNRSH